MIRDLYNANPDPAMMSPGAPIQQQLARLQTEVAGFGAVEKISKGWEQGRGHLLCQMGKGLVGVPNLVHA